MNDNSIGSGRVEPTDNTTVRVYIERPDGEPSVLYLEPGNALHLAEDGPVSVEVFATED